MKIQIDPKLPFSDSLPDLKRRLTDLLRDIAQQLNSLSEGAIVGSYNARTAAPTSGAFAVGDFVRNSAPAELGSAGSKYVIHGWQCVAAGSPGTWVQCRFLTGN